LSKDHSDDKERLVQNWMTGFVIAACVFYGFSLVSKNEQQQTEANTSVPAAIASARPANADNPVQQPPAPPLSFGGYPCGGDCSVQQEGYRWAESNNIADPDSCTGNSAEFIEGCRVYALKRNGTG
jgi:hypothetical protein